MTIELPNNKPLSQQIAELLEARILSGEFQVGQKLPTENELTTIYKVSRTVIREAIKTLKEKGWVETFVAKGTFVVHKTDRRVQSSFDAAMRMKSEDRFENLIELRSILEPEMAALAALRASDEQLAKMKEAVQFMDKTLEDGNDVESFLEGDFTFHMTMAESTGNPLVQVIIRPVDRLFRELQEFHLQHVKGGNQRSQSRHRLIIEAIERHDPEAARLHMRDHIMQLRNDIENQRAIESSSSSVNPGGKVKPR